MVEPFVDKLLQYREVHQKAGGIERVPGNRNIREIRMAVQPAALARFLGRNVMGGRELHILIQFVRIRMTRYRVNLLHHGEHASRPDKAK
jgi:hypothetical protein